MKKLTPRYLSQKRKEFGSRFELLKRLYQRVCSDELLFHGQPGSVYRKCGKPQCKCSEGGEKRHGPYHIIRVFRNKKNTQVTLKPDEMHFLEMAKSYQQHIRNRKRIIELQKELLTMFDELIRRRTLWEKKEYRK